MLPLWSLPTPMIAAARTISLPSSSASHSGPSLRLTSRAAYRATERDSPSGRHPLTPALVLDHGSDMPHAHLERERASEYILRSLSMNMTMCRTVCAVQALRAHELPPPASKPGSTGLIP